MLETETLLPFSNSTNLLVIGGRANLDILVTVLELYFGIKNHFIVIDLQHLLINLVLSIKLVTTPIAPDLLQANTIVIVLNGRTILMDLKWTTISFMVGPHLIGIEVIIELV